jgi:tRNA (guanine-N7-)-methyltransferase
MELYKKLLKNEGFLRLKTDNYPLFEYSLASIAENGFEILGQTTDLYNSELQFHHLNRNNEPIETYYERMFREKGFKINYLVAKMK